MYFSRNEPKINWKDRNVYEDNHRHSLILKLINVLFQVKISVISDFVLSFLKNLSFQLSENFVES